MTDTAKRSAERLRAYGTPEDIARVNAARVRAGKLPIHSWEAQRERLYRILRAYAEGWGDVESIDGCEWYDNWAPGSGKAEHGVIVANWNDEPWARLETLFERLPHGERPELTYSDEITRCDGCDLAIGTQPDSYGWEPGYVQMGDGSELCVACGSSEASSFVEYANSRGWSASMKPYGEWPQWLRDAGQGFRLYDY